MASAPPPERPETLRPTDDEAVRLAKTLLRTARHGALAVLEPVTGAPLASRVALACDHDGAPLVLVSTLSSHTGALIADRRCSLLVGEPGKGDPLAHPRISLACEAVRLERGTPDHARARRRFLSHNPKSALYADFADFAFFRLEPGSASLNGGFGRAFALTRDNILVTASSAPAVAAAAEGALVHMNQDHAQAVELYARAFGGAEPGPWRLAGLDAEGIDLALGDQRLRIAFAAPLADAADLRRVLADMARRARAQLSFDLPPDGTASRGEVL